jgi:hypothetical protein
MFEAQIPGDFGKNLLNITTKLRTQNRWLKITVGALALTVFVFYLRNLKKAQNKYSTPKQE